jgi:hypothetical protein
VRFEMRLKGLGFEGLGFEGLGFEGLGFEGLGADRGDDRPVHAAAVPVGGRDAGVDDAQRRHRSGRQAHGGDGHPRPAGPSIVVHPVSVRGSARRPDTAHAAVVMLLPQLDHLVGIGVMAHRNGPRATSTSLTGDALAGT